MLFSESTTKIRLIKQFIYFVNATKIFKTHLEILGGIQVSLFQDTKEGLHLIKGTLDKERFAFLLKRRSVF